MLDYRGNNRDGGWDIQGTKRGDEEYFPPYGWNGFGLNVLDKYKDNKWLGCINSEGEWSIAYHGVGRGQALNEVKKSTGNIIKSGFKKSKYNAREFDKDLRHPGNKCGIGVYWLQILIIENIMNGLEKLNLMEKNIKLF